MDILRRFENGEQVKIACGSGTYTELQGRFECFIDWEATWHIRNSFPGCFRITHDMSPEQKRFEAKHADRYCDGWRESIARTLEAIA